MTTTQTSQVKARIAGALWLIVVIGVQVLGEYATRTASSSPTESTEFQLRAGVIALIVAWAAYIPVTVLLWDLLRPAGSTLATTAAVAGIVAIAIGLTGVLMRLAPLLLVGEVRLALSVEQTLGAASILRGWSFQLTGLSWVFFGMQCAMNGFLIARSKIVPPFLGILLAVGAVLYIVVPLLSLLSPELARPAFAFMALAALTGEGALSAWLLAKGVRILPGGPSNAQGSRDVRGA